MLPFWATLFAYDGWILLAALGGEMKNPEKLLPRAMTGGLLIVTAIYLFINFALLHMLSANDIVRLGENATSTAATMLFGPIGRKVDQHRNYRKYFWLLKRKNSILPADLICHGGTETASFFRAAVTCSPDIPHAMDSGFLSDCPDGYPDVP